MNQCYFNIKSISRIFVHCFSQGVGSGSLMPYTPRTDNNPNELNKLCIGWVTWYETLASNEGAARLGHNNTASDRINIKFSICDFDFFFGDWTDVFITIPG